MLFEKQKQSGRGKNYTTITFKLLKPQNTEALTKEKFANTEEKKKLLYVCNAVGQAMLLYGQFS